jgi:uncharacterized protein
MNDRPIVFVTGASSGIGAEAVAVFAEAGFDVVFSARRKDRLEALADKLRPAFPKAQLLPIVCDVTRDESVAAAMDFLRERFGKLDALINNAGYGIYGSLENTSLDSVKANFETNVFGMLRCTQQALPLLREAKKQSSKRWGASIVMISSFVGRRAIPNLSSYSATKFAMEAFAESLRVELWDEGIAVSVVNPGATSTEFFDAAEGKRPSGFSKPRMTARTVAQQILRASRKPIRNIYLTAEGRAGLAAQWLVPSLMDHLMLKQVWRKRHE